MKNPDEAKSDATHREEIRIEDSRSGRVPALTKEQAMVNFAELVRDFREKGIPLEMEWTDFGLVVCASYNNKDALEQGRMELQKLNPEGLKKYSEEIG